MAGLGDMFGASMATVNGKNPRNSDRIQAGQPLNLRGAFEAAQNIPVAGDILSGVMAAYDAAKGDYPSAVMNAVGVLPFVSGTFIGKGAKTWDALKAADAEKRIAVGDDVRKVWKETGTFKGPDGHLRQEIDDSKARFSPSPAFFTNEGGVRQGNVLNHPDLYAADYGLENIMTKRMNEPGGSFYQVNVNDSFRPDLSSIEIGTHAVKKTPLGFKADPVEAVGTNLHELQHAVQHAEGWAQGGSLQPFIDLNKSLRNTDTRQSSQLEAMYRAKENGGIDPVSGFQIDAIRENLKRIAAQKEDLLSKEGARIDPMEAYKRLAGEAEARATQARMNMNMEQRLNAYPLDSYDVPVDQLIIRGNTPIGAAFK